MSDLGYGDAIHWTAEDLGVPIVTDGNGLVSEFWRRFNEIFDSRRLYWALRNDLPFDLYWGYYSRTYVITDVSENGDWVDITGLKAGCCVHSEYQAGDEYTMNTAIGQTVVTAGNNARAIVAKYAGASDYEKLRGYNHEIIKLVDYNDDESVDNGGPWDCIWVFDGDPSTNVVCEGYAMAFQHLCNLTKFDNDAIQCNTVWGLLSASPVNVGSDFDHAWNVVHMENGKNYMVDVTWNDSPGYGAELRYFLKECDDGDYPQYFFNLNWYIYSEITMNLYGEKWLAISREKYVPAPSIITQPKDITVTIGQQAIFTVKAAEAGTVTYQWYSRPNVDAEWAVVDGATSDTYTVIGTMDNNGWQFRCRVKNEGGEVYSNAATLMVTKAAPPTIKTQPKDANVKSGAKAKFTVKVKEKHVTYQWYYRTSETGEWILIDGATKATYEVVAEETNLGWQFRCLAKNADGQAYSNPATLRMK